MKKGSLFRRYKKAIRENANSSEEKKRNIRHSFVTKLFFRIFLSSLVLFSFVIIDNTFSTTDFSFKEYFQNKSINFSKMSLYLNKVTGNYLDIESDKEVFDIKLLEEVEFVNNQNRVINYSFNGVYNIANGVVTKIYENDEGLYEVTIVGGDNFTYVYKNLENVDYSIYSFVKQNEIIGHAKYDQNSYHYILEIIKDGKKYDIYDYEQMSN